MVRGLVALGLLGGVCGDFAYVDFNQTQGLRFNGDAATSACEEVEARSYGPYESNAGEGRSETLYGEDDEAITTVTVETNVNSARQDEDLRTTRATMGHRDAYEARDTSCAGRLRLTPSRPRARGSVWYHLPVPVHGGFEALFTFKVTDQSRHCTKHRDLDFSLELYEKCWVRGGDGIAFVVHDDPNRTEALGGSGGDLGYGGIARSVAVELDTDYNPDGGGAFAGDAAPVDHVELRSRGAAPNAAAGADALLAPVVFHDLADGREHLVKVKYVPRLAMEYFANFSAYPAAARYMVDGGENRRLGLFLVFLDDGVAADSPSIAVPLNLPEMLALGGDGRAYVGLTASTGARWQKHDITSFAVCDRPDCASAPSPSSEKFDYHLASRKTGKNVAFHYSAGTGFGGAVRDVGAPEDRGASAHASPDNDPVGPDVEHHANGRNEGNP